MKPFHILTHLPVFHFNIIIPVICLGVFSYYVPQTTYIRFLCCDSKNYHFYFPPWYIYGAWAGRSLLRVMGTSTTIDVNAVMKVIHSRSPWFNLSQHKATPNTSWLILASPSPMSLFINITNTIQIYYYPHLPWVSFKVLAISTSGQWIGIPPIIKTKHRLLHKRKIRK